MDSCSFDRLVAQANEKAALAAENSRLQKLLRLLARRGSPENCPPGMRCARQTGRNCEMCWLAWAGLEPLPVLREREKSLRSH